MTAESPPPELASTEQWPDHPVICTFAVRLPFPLRLPDASSFVVQGRGEYRNDEDRTRFGDDVWVRIRTRNQPTGGMDIWPTHGLAVAEALYGVTVDIPADALPKWQSDSAYEQWVSLETPSGRLADESDTDQAYHFHRCLAYLNIFLQSHILAFRDSRVHPISTPELRQLVLVGQLELDGDGWSFQIPLLTHIEALPVFEAHEITSDLHGEDLLQGLVQIQAGNPFVVATLMTMRAEDASSVRGDWIDAIVSLETAMESRLYALWRCLLVDLGYRGHEIEHGASADAPYRTLLVTTLPSLLGGRWDTTAAGTEVGDYWEHLYPRSFAKSPGDPE